MGFLSNLFGSKKSDALALPQKQAQYSVGGFEASFWSRDRSVLWIDNANAANDSLSRLEVARQARYCARNHPIFERILSVCEVYGVGNGLIPNAATGDPDFDKAATDAFDQWANNVFCTVTNDLTFYEAQKLIARELVLVGECFVVLVKAQTGRPQLMLVKSENVRSSGTDGDDSLNGVYLDQYGKALAYNIFTGTGDGFTKVLAENVVHLCVIKEIGQVRGYSPFASALNSARDLADVRNLEKKAVKTHASLAAVVTKKDGQASNGLNGFVAKDLIPATDLPGFIPADSNGPKTNRGLEMGFGGTVAYLNPGEEVTLLAGNRSTDGTRSFFEILAREVCLAISLPYEFLVNPDKLTGTGVRFAIADASFYFQNLQNVLIDQGIKRIYTWVIASFIKSGVLKVPENLQPWAVSFTRPVSITVDLQRASNVDVSLLQNSLTTYETYYSARGKNYEEELTQKAKEEALLDQLSKEYKIDINRLRSLAAGVAPIPQQNNSLSDDSAGAQAA